LGNQLQLGLAVQQNLVSRKDNLLRIFQQLCLHDSSYLHRIFDNTFDLCCCKCLLGKSANVLCLLGKLIK
jgi:hypothetical protein